MPEAKPRDANITVGIIAIWYFNKETFLMAQSEAEGFKNGFVIEVSDRNYTHGAICIHGHKYT